jgi:hypothetical protein
MTCYTCFAVKKATKLHWTTDMDYTIVMHGKKAETMREQHQAVNGLRRWCGQRGLDLVTEFRELDGPSWDTCICDGIKRCGGDGEEDYD